jgi:hypothetical protein
MCENACKDCKLVRFMKPSEGRSFCVDKKEATKVDSNIRRVNRYSLYTTTHRESVEVCDHKSEFVKK